MAPETHLLVSWVIGAKATDNPRDCRLVAFAGILPDLDGLGLLADGVARLLGQRTHYYEHYHHYLLHGAFGALVIATLACLLARRRWRVALLALFVYHLHLLCDFAGSRGPSPEDLWAIFYFGPFDRDPMWIWKGQWRLDAWPNRILSVALFGWALVLAIQLGHSFVGTFNRRADAIFVEVLKRWHSGWLTWRGNRQNDVRAD
ncbi:MAG TPA: metal-dependent hydrolase [Clostridia bacterium]|nr:metal-dependent hydrolase [Clostridia bacterium]